MWQAIYEELGGDDFEIIAVAFDTGGKAAVEARTLAADCREQPEAIGRLMCWPDDLWARQSPPTYTCLIDEGHTVAELYGMVNVPQGVWIDENGRIVRPPESAGTADMAKHMDRETFEIPDDIAAEGAKARTTYIDALRDWVKKGDDSVYALSAAEVRKRMQGPSEDEVLAATHVKLGRHLFATSKLDAAKHHFAEASRLHPASWNYRRQSMMLDPESIGQLNTAPEFWAAVEALGDEPYYPLADLPEPA